MAALTCCDICLECHPTVSCPLIQNVLQISDTEPLPKALASLPSVLQARSSNMESAFQVFTSAIIEKGTQFGPLQATVVSERSSSESKYIVKAAENGPIYLDTTCLNQCNWMCLVRWTEHEEMSNSIVYQLSGKLFFLVTKEIEPGCELVVTYSPGYKTFIENSVVHAYTISTQIDCPADDRNSNSLQFDTSDHKQDTHPEITRVRNGTAGRLEQNGNFICEVCGAHYTKFSSLKTHRSTHGPRRYECPTCGKQFHRQTLLSEHRFVHLPPQFVCQECGNTLKTRKALDVHLTIHTGMKQFVCDFQECNKAFCQKGNLLSHQLTHVPLEEKDFQCPYCSKRLASKESFHLHVKSHEEKPFKCSLCDKQFVTDVILKKHQRVAHTKERYSCAFCSLIVKQKHTFRRHLLQKHSEFSETWLSEGHIENCFQVHDGIGTGKAPSSRRKTIVVEVVGEDVLELTSSNQNVSLDRTGEELQIEDSQEDQVILSSTADETDNEISCSDSELILLHLNQDGEFVLKLGHGGDVAENAN